MTGHRQCDKRRPERGAAMLIAIFALLLISVVAIALIVSSGTDSALASNYRTSASAYYAALAGIEEARGRLLGTNANPIALPATPMDLTQVVYIINPLNGEPISPENGSNPSTYPDNEYKQEFGVDVNGDGTVDQITPLFYDPANMNASRNAMAPGLIETLAPPATAQPLQALEITSYAVLPNGSQKMLQAVVRPLVEFPSLTAPGFTAALTLAGNNVTFTGPGTNSFVISGQDPCPNAPVMLPAIGYTIDPSTGDTSQPNIVAGATPASNYVGSSTVSSPQPGAA